jgi:hypothetical protein
VFLNQNAAYVDLSLKEIADAAFRGNRTLARDTQTFLGTSTPQVLLADASLRETESPELDISRKQLFYLG